MRVAVTGGAGYIGSHTTVALLDAGHEVLVLDNFVNAERDVPCRIAAIAGRQPEVAEVDICNAAKLNKELMRFRPDALIHFAGLKAVGEAVKVPLEYYWVNVAGSLTLFRALEEVGCSRLVFSSSATVYGDPEQVPIPEDHPLRPTNPYGYSKLVIEKTLEDWGVAWDSLASVSLRYFNPVGAHPSALIGEAPQGAPNNLMPYVSQVAAGWRKELLVFGDDYNTPDGTGVRDYIHVMDLAEAHLASAIIDRREDGRVRIQRGHWTWSFCA